jgi:hypothetical protein
MIEILKEFLKDLEITKEFKKFKEEAPLAYNTSACYIDKVWQLDFYDPNTDKMTSFTKKDDEIVSQTSEVFRKEKKDIPELKIENIKVDLDQVEKLIEQKHPDKPTNKIIILQQKDNPFWNITHLTTKLDLLNIKIDAVTGKIVEEKIESALNFKK